MTSQTRSALFVCGLVAIGCSQSTNSLPPGDGEIPGEGAGSGGDRSTGTAFDSSEAGPADPGMAAPPSTSEPVGSGGAEPGTLTAGVWDDNRNFQHFMSFRDAAYETEHSALPGFTAEEHENAHASSGLSAHQRLDVALVIDATGSMGDEMAYLQAEFLALSNTIEERFPSSDQRWSLVVYRDETDDYVARWFDFRDDPEEFRGHLADQEANGGGDYPEASHAALEVMNQLSWRSGDDVARLAFWVADAPHHPEHAADLTEAVRDAQAAGIHVYPVASSGVDELTELSMRATAQLTHARYVFLTDDSGVGGAHLEPSIPCYFVTKLDDAILRMVDIEMSGEYSEPASDTIIRTGGDPENGACQLESGTTVAIY